jgi:hypothetical protein
VQGLHSGCSMFALHCLLRWRGLLPPHPTPPPQTFDAGAPTTLLYSRVFITPLSLTHSSSLPPTHSLALPPLVSLYRSLFISFFQPCMLPGSLLLSLSPLPLFSPRLLSRSSLPLCSPSLLSLSSFPLFSPALLSLSSLSLFSPSLLSLSSLPLLSPSILSLSFLFVSLAHAFSRRCSCACARSLSHFLSRSLSSPSVLI